MSHSFARRPTRPHQRSSSSRGAVAVMACVFSVMGVLLMACVLEYGFLVIQRRQANQTADATAQAWALQVRDAPMRYWSNPYFAPDSVKAGNMKSADAISATTFQPPYFDAGNVLSASPRYLDAWLPVFVRVRSSYPVTDTTAIGRIVTGGGVLGLSEKLPQLDGAASVRVSQVQLSSFRMQPERVMLLLDFSRTMSLNYAPNGTTGSVPAYQTLQTAATTIIDHYGSLINLGVLMFSDGQKQTSIDLANQNNALNGMTDDAQTKITNKVIGTTPMGDGTDLAGAIALGTTMLARSGGDLSQSAARIIMITDGEPDMLGGSAASSGGSRDDMILGFRQQTQLAMDAAWNNPNLAMGGVTSDIFFIQRQGQEETGDPIGGVTTQDFLSGLSGSKQVKDGSNFLGTGGDPAAIDKFIDTQLTLQPRCYMNALRTVEGLNLYPTTSRYVLPQRDRSGKVTGLSAFFVPNAKTQPYNEVQMTLYIDDLAGYNTAQATAGAYLDPGSKAVPAGYFDDPANRRSLIAHYDSNTGILVTGGMLCAAFATGSNPIDYHMRIRLRWGAPRPVATDCVAAANTARCSY